MRGRNDGNARSSGRSISNCRNGMAHVSVCVAALTSVHHWRAMSFHAVRSTSPSSLVSGIGMSRFA